MNKKIVASASLCYSETEDGRIEVVINFDPEYDPDGNPDDAYMCHLMAIEAEQLLRGEREASMGTKADTSVTLECSSCEATFERFASRPAVKALAKRANWDIEGDDDFHCPQCKERFRLQNEALDAAISEDRGQEFLWDLVRALEDLPEEKLIVTTYDDVNEGWNVIGAMARYRGVELDPTEDPSIEAVNELNVGEPLARALMDLNDNVHFRDGTDRWDVIRVWAIQRFNEEYKAMHKEVCQ